MRGRWGEAREIGAGGRGVCLTSVGRVVEYLTKFIK